MRLNITISLSFTSMPEQNASLKSHIGFQYNQHATPLFLLHMNEQPTTFLLSPMFLHTVDIQQLT